MSALYEPAGDGRFQPSGLTRGPWDPGAQHGGAPAALLGGLLEDPDGALRVARVTFELVRPVPLAELRAETEVVRPGRRVQLVAGRLHAGDQVVMRALALRIRRGEGPETGEREPAPGAPETARPRRLPAQPEGLESFAGGEGMEIRFSDGNYDVPGPAAAWFRLRAPVVAGEPIRPLQRALAAADFGNGISAVLDWNRHLFINPDLTVYLEREPEGEWIALDARTRMAGDGTGLAESVLHDAGGRIGQAEQALLIDTRA